jgi:large subunit ribosomal protein L15
MPLFRRLPKRGFSNYKFATRYEIVNVSQLERFDDGAAVGPEQLSNAGLICSCHSKVKVLGNGELTRKLKDVAARLRWLSSNGASGAQEGMRHEA